MRFTTIVTTLYAIAAAGVMSAPVDQPKVGVATEGNVTATVEVVKTDDGIDVARITYTTVDVEHPDKLAPPVSRFCWNIGGECSTLNAPLERSLSLLYRPSADSKYQVASRLSLLPWSLALRPPLPLEPVRNKFFHITAYSTGEKPKMLRFVCC